MKKNQEQNNQKKKEAKKEHKIRTFYVQDMETRKLAATSKSGDQLYVRELEPGDISEIKKRIVGEKEEGALQEMEGKTLEHKGVKSQEAIKASQIETEDLEDLAELFNKHTDEILVIDKTSIQSPSIPKEGRHFLVPQAWHEKTGEKAKFRQHLESLGYRLSEFPSKEAGFKAEKGETKLNFVFAEQ